MSAPTTFTRVIHGVTVRVSMAEAFAPQADGYFTIFESLPASALADGTTIQAGWGYLRPRAQPGGSVILTAPDHAGATAEWVTDLTTEAFVLTSQIEAIRRLGVEPQQCLAPDRIVVEQGALTAPAVYFHRTATNSANDSGWFLGLAVRADRKELSSLPAYALMQSRPELVPYLMLPDEHMVFVRDSVVTSVRSPTSDELLN